MKGDEESAKIVMLDKTQIGEFENEFVDERQEN